MLLLLDIGNSNIVGCLYNETDKQNTPWHEIMRIKTDLSKDYFHYVKTVNYSIAEHIDKVTEVVVSSVVPELNSAFYKIITKIYGFNPMWVNCELFDKLPIEIPQQRIIGSDIVANAMAGYKKAPEGCIVCDFGTVLTFTTVFDKKIQSTNFVPGLNTALYSLHKNTAQLPKIKMELPKSIFAANTKQAMLSGIIFGYSGLVDRIIEQIKKEAQKDKLQIIATGGLGDVLKPYCTEKLNYDLHHTVLGLKLIYEYCK